MEASKIEVKEQVPASRKLQATDARKLARAASKIIVAKGKKVQEFSNAGAGTIEAMLGSTGNLRAPTLQVGKTLLVGFNQDVYEATFG